MLIEYEIWLERTHRRSKYTSVIKFISALQSRYTQLYKDRLQINGERYRNVFIKMKVRLDIE
jgi:hypothetical protein